MHTCDGCVYELPGGGCARESYPELDGDVLRKRYEDRKRRKEAVRRFLYRLLPWNWFTKEKQP